MNDLNKELQKMARGLRHLADAHRADVQSCIMAFGSAGRISTKNAIYWQEQARIIYLAERRLRGVE